MRIKKDSLLVSCLVLLFLNTGAWACNDINVSRGALIKQVQQFKSVELIRSKIHYHENQDENYSAGYRPDKVSVVEGDVCVSVYDFDKGYRAHDAYAEMKRTLTKLRGGAADFECLSQQCGDIDGWKLFLDPSIAGQSDHQYYLFKGVGNHVSGEYLMADMMHVSEFDQRSRLTHVSFVSTHLSQIKGLKLARKTLTLGSDSRRLGTVYFPSGVSDINESDTDEILNSLRTLKHNERVLLVGFADNAGSKQRNFDLSKARAESVEQYLLGKSLVVPSNFIVIPSGETHSSGGLSKSRRVDVYVVKSPISSEHPL